jgi:hypothetical protein
MRQSQTAVLERNTTYTGPFETEPFEAAWAGEGRWFVQVIRASDEASVALRTQISPDGLTWCDYDDVDHVLGEQLLSTWPVREFGQWLRLRGEVTGHGACVTLRIYLAVKS